MSVEIDVLYEGDLRCLASHGPSKAVFSTDAPTDNGGKGAAFSPTDLVAASLASCMLTIMGIAAQRVELDISGARVRAVKTMTAQPPRRIAELALVVSLPRPLDAAQRTRLEAAAATCPVKLSLHPEVKVTVKYEYPS